MRPDLVIISEFRFFLYNLPLVSRKKMNSTAQLCISLACSNLLDTLLDDSLTEDSESEEDQHFAGSAVVTMALLHLASKAKESHLRQRG